MPQKIALVIGGSGGIGSAVIERLLDDGFFVCATYAHDGPRKEAVQKKFEGKAISFHQMDLLDPSAVAEVLQKIRMTHEHIDVLVFGPTLSKLHKALLECTWSDFEAHLYVQLRGMVYCIENLKEQIRAKYPLRCIVLLTEACIGKPPSHMSPYVTAKYALMGFTKTIAAELAPYGCTAMMVSPGMVKTDLLSDFPAKMVEFAAARRPEGKLSDPKDVAQVVSFLASEGAVHLNGAHVDLHGKEVAL